MDQDDHEDYDQYHLPKYDIESGVWLMEGQIPESDFTLFGDVINPNHFDHIN